jgi:hypothetical protein
VEAQPVIDPSKGAKAIIADHGGRAACATTTCSAGAARTGSTASTATT